MGTAVDSGTGTDDAQVGGEPHGGGGIARYERLGLSLVQVLGVRVVVIEAGTDTSSQVKIQVNKNKRRCLRL